MQKKHTISTGRNHVVYSPKTTLVSVATENYQAPNLAPVYDAKDGLEGNKLVMKGAAIDPDYNTLTNFNLYTT